jgi:hypothetical protein
VWRTGAIADEWMETSLRARPARSPLETELPRAAARIASRALPLSSRAKRGDEGTCKHAQYGSYDEAVILARKKKRLWFSSREFAHVFSKEIIVLDGYDKNFTRAGHFRPMTTSITLAG